jgi:quercetin dioxygenase-like cupin family protein
MPFVDTSSLDVIERLPGWYGRYFQSPSMTFAHYDFTRGASIHEHFHPQEEVYEVIEGELEVTIDGTTQVARAGLVAIVPSDVRHSVKALTERPSHHRRLSAAARIRQFDWAQTVAFRRQVSPLALGMTRRTVARKTFNIGCIPRQPRRGC